MGWDGRRRELEESYHVHKYQVITSRFVLFYCLLTVVCHVTQVACHCKLAQEDPLIH